MCRRTGQRDLILCTAYRSRAVSSASFGYIYLNFQQSFILKNRRDESYETIGMLAAGDGASLAGILFFISYYFGSFSACRAPAKSF